jgi:hypothetical protein
VRGAHDLMRRIFAGADNQTGVERPAGNRERSKRAFLHDELILSSTNEIDDFDLVPLVDRGTLVTAPFDDLEIELDGDTPRVDVQPFQQSGDGQGFGDFVWLAVQADRHAAAATCAAGAPVTSGYPTGHADELDGVRDERTVVMLLDLEMHL